jgi:hypothetical protein
MKKIGCISLLIIIIYISDMTESVIRVFGSYPRLKPAHKFNN